MTTFERSQLVKENKTGCFLDYLYFKHYYKMITLDLIKD